MRDKDYYKILSVSETAPLNEIKSAYRKLAKKYHPDMNPTNKKAAEEAFKKISEAYYVLGDEKRRQEYDAFRKGAYYTRRPSQGFEGAQGFNIEDLLSHLGFAAAKGRRGRPVSADFDLFDEVFSQGGGRGFSRVYTTGSREQKIETNINASVEIPQNLAVNGGKIDLTLPNGKKITVIIPKGTTNGTKLRLHDLGKTCSCCGHKGDLLLRIGIKNA